MYAQNLPFHNLKCTNFHVLYTIYKYVLYYIFVFWFRFVVDDVVVRVVYTQNRYISIHDSWSRVRRVKSRDETKRAELREEQRRDRRGNAQMRRAETRRKGAKAQSSRGWNRQSSVRGALLYTRREHAEQSARGGDRHVHATKERRISSTSNTAHTSSSRARLHNACAHATPLTRRSANVQRTRASHVTKGAYNILVYWYVHCTVYDAESVPVVPNRHQTTFCVSRSDCLGMFHADPVPRHFLNIVSVWLIRHRETDFNF